MTSTSLRLAVSVLVIATLAGCASASPKAEPSAKPDAQSDKEACAIVAQATETVAHELAEALGDLMENPQGAVDALADFGLAFEDAASRVTNSQVKAATLDAAEAFEGFRGIESTDPEAMLAAQEEAEGAVAKIGQICG